MSARPKHGAAKQGPYDENNPAPPPTGPPPGSQNRGEQSKDRQYETPYKRLNSRQRKKLRDQAGRDGQKGHHASDGAAKNTQQSSQDSRVEDTFAQEDERGEDLNGRQNTHGRRRRSLRDARKYTPDQIMDETPGRLSPGRIVDEHTTNWNDASRSAEQTLWPEGTFQSSCDIGDDQARGRSRQESAYERQTQPYGQKKKGRYRSQSREQQHGWARRSVGVSSTPEPRASQPYGGFEDEVDWDDGETFDMPPKTRSSYKPSASAIRPSHMNLGNPKLHASAKGKKRPTSPPTSPRQQKRHAWNDKAVEVQQEYTNPRWPPKPKPRTTTGYAPINKAYTRKSYHQDRPVNKEVEGKQLKDPLLQDDQNIVGLATGLVAPATAYDLRKYDHYIGKMHQKLPKYQRYRHGSNGKLAPHKYGAPKNQDLGLCFATFCTIDRCEMGIKCAWRHHPLTKAEREWILLSGDRNARLFLENLVKFWAVPEVPVPGASMHDK